MKRGAKAEWNGDLKGGKGSVTLDSGVLKQAPFSFVTRFEPGVTGTNPEELVAGAHAGCFSMAFSAQLSGAGFVPESVKTTATLTMEKLDAGWTTTEIHLDCVAKVPGIDQAKFDELAEGAKKGCPISRLLNTKITLTKTLQK